MNGEAVHRPKTPGARCTGWRWSAVFALCACHIGTALADGSPRGQAGPPSSNLAAGSCAADFDPRSPLTLPRAASIALCNNSTIRIAWEKIDVQAAEVGQAAAAYWPTLTAQVSELAERTAYSSYPAPESTSAAPTVFAALNWRIFDFGTRSATYRASEALLMSAMANRDATIQSVLGSVIQAYFQVMTARATADAMEENASISHQTLEAAQRRLAQGSGSENDVLQATAAYAKAALQDHRAQGTEQESIAVLGQAMGVPVGTSITLPQDLNTQTGHEQRDLQDWLQDAQAHHPAIRAAEASVRAARENVIATRSAGRPTVDMTANYYQNGFPNQGLSDTHMRDATIGVIVTIPIFDGFARKYRLFEANADLRLKQTQLQDLKQDVLTQVVRAYVEAQTSLSNLEPCEMLLQAAQSAYESSQRRYTNGAAEILELLTAQTVLSNARTDSVTCTDEWQSARLNLFTSAGLLNVAEILQ